jgi:uncharacterized protein
MGDGSTALVVRGGWEGHEPEKTSSRFAGFLRQSGFEVVVSDTLDAYADLDLMSRVGLVVQTWTQGQITSRQLAGLSEAVARGAGLAGWHGGIIDSFRDSTEYQFITGGQWVAHPDGFVDYAVQFMTNQNDHPLIAGLADFSIRTEQYYMHVDPGNRVLATTTFGQTDQAPWVRGVVMPVVWTRFWGRGRVFVNAIGHNDRDFEVPEVEEVTRRGLLWAAGRQERD